MISREDIEEEREYFNSLTYDKQKLWMQCLVDITKAEERNKPFPWTFKNPIPFRYTVSFDLLPDFGLEKIEVMQRRLVEADEKMDLEELIGVLKQ